MKKNKPLIYYTIEQVLVFCCIFASTFVFVKTTSNLLIYYVWANLIAVICLKIMPTENKIFNMIYYNIIQPIGHIYNNYRSFSTRPIFMSLKIIVIVNIIITTILVAAGWFVTATAYLITSVITYKTYISIPNQNEDFK